MAKKIYIGEILGEVMHKVSLLQADLQDVVNQMVTVASNTSYLENLYLATGRRSVLTYSAADNTLSARKSAAVNLLDTDIDYTLGANNSALSTDSLKFSNGGSLTINCSNIDSISFVPSVTSVFPFGANTGSISIDGVVVPDSTIVVNNTNGATITGNLITIDLSDKEEVKLDFSTNAGGGYYDLLYFSAYFNDGHISGTNYTNSAVVTSNKITIADNYNCCKFTLSPITSIAWAGWDCITYMISEKNIHCKIDVLKTDGTILIEDIKSGEVLSGLSTYEFYLHFDLCKSDGISPLLESVSYLYLT